MQENIKSKLMLSIDKTMAAKNDLYILVYVYVGTCVFISCALTSLPTQKSAFAAAKEKWDDSHMTTVSTRREQLELAERVSQARVAELQATLRETEERADTDRRDLHDTIQSVAEAHQAQCRLHVEIYKCKTFYKIFNHFTCKADSVHIQ